MNQDKPRWLEEEDRWHWLQASPSLFQDQSDAACHIPSATKKWRQVSSEISPCGRCSHSMTEIPDWNCLLLVGGGFVEEGKENFVHLNDVWMLHALTAEWQRIEPRLSTSRFYNADEPQPSYWGMELNPPRRGHLATAYKSQYLILFGGMTDDDVLLNDLWLLRLATMEWKRLDLPDAPSARRGGVAFCHGDYFYVIAGHDSERLVVVHKMGPLSGENWSWSLQHTTNHSFLHKRSPQWPTMSLGPRPLQSLKYPAHALVGTKLYLFGGLERHDDNVLVSTNLLYRLDLETWEWTVLYVPHKAPCSRFFHGMASLGRFLVVVGGLGMLTPDQESSNDTMLLVHEDDGIETNSGIRQCTIFDVSFFDTETLTWKRETVEQNWPKARNGMTFTRLGRHHLIVFGGGVFQQDYYSDTHALDFHFPVSGFENAMPSEFHQGNHELAADLGQLYKSGLLSDITLVAGNRHFAVHKAVLASRCNVFHTMLTGPYVESNTSLKEITVDSLPDAVDVCLKFLYTHQVDTTLVLEDQELLSSVLSLVDFWDMQDLMKILEQALGRLLLKDRMEPLDLLAFAKAHHCRRLVLQCLEYCKLRQDSLCLDGLDMELRTEIEGYVKSLV